MYSTAVARNSALCRTQGLPSGSVKSGVSRRSFLPYLSCHYQHGAMAPWTRRKILVLETVIPPECLPPSRSELPVLLTGITAEVPNLSERKSRLMLRSASEVAPGNGGQDPIRSRDRFD